MASYYNKGGRPPLVNKCGHCVMVRFDDTEWERFIAMMERAGQTVKATFIKQQVFGKPFKVLTTDKSLAVYTSKLSEFFTQYRNLGVNYNLLVKELRANFTEKKALRYLYKLEQATMEMTAVLQDVRILTEKFQTEWSQKSQ